MHEECVVEALGGRRRPAGTNIKNTELRAPEPSRKKDSNRGNLNCARLSVRSGDVNEAQFLTQRSSLDGFFGSCMATNTTPFKRCGWFCGSCRAGVIGLGDRAGLDHGLQGRQAQENGRAEIDRGIDAFKIHILQTADWVEHSGCLLRPTAVWRCADPQADAGRLPRFPFEEQLFLPSGPVTILAHAF